MTMTETMKDAAGPGRGGRMSRQRKREAVLRLLRGEDLDTVSRSLGVTAATLSTWRDAFLTAGQASLATRPASGSWTWIMCWLCETAKGLYSCR
jgi:transposase